jgi:NAD(P)-dependent dehydrogenase (short-subunit alcohol dehydrogenase family)
MAQCRSVLTESKILITGGSRGLGEAFARACVGAGARVAISDILHERGQTLANEIGAHYIAMDMKDAAQIERGINEAAERLGGLSALVNNAAVTNSGGKKMADIPAQTFDDVMAVNVRGVWQASVAAQAHLKASGIGRIVNIASDTALWGAPNLMAYVASKGAVMAMTRSMARELGPDNITVNALAPGLTLTESTEYVPKIRHDYYLAGRAIPREQTPDDCVSTLLYLLSPASAFVTGQVIPVNGGFVMR